jgi:hypothetical protein
VEVGTLEVRHRYAGFEDFWASFEAGYGASGKYLASLDGTTRQALREEVRGRLGGPEGSFELDARARYVRGLAAA